MQPSNEPIQPGRSAPRQPNKVGLLLAGIGGGVLLMNHWSAASSNKVYIWLLVLGPVLLFLGLGSLYDGRILTAAGREPASVPMPYRIAAVSLVLLALLTSAWLTFAVYHAF